MNDRRYVWSSSSVEFVWIVFGILSNTYCGIRECYRISAKYKFFTAYSRTGVVWNIPSQGRTSKIFLLAILFQYLGIFRIENRCIKNLEKPLELFKVLIKIVENLHKKQSRILWIWFVIRQSADINLLWVTLCLFSTIYPA